MNKGISNLYAYAQKSLAANGRYLDALAGVEPTADALEQLDGICEKKSSMGNRCQLSTPWPCATFPFPKSSSEGSITSEVSEIAM